MATIITEGFYSGHYVVSEANGGATGVSRSIGTITVLSGQNLIAGAVIMDDGAGKENEFDGVGAAIGVLFDNVDASSTGANADVDGCAYHSRDCQVNGLELQYHVAINQTQKDQSAVDMATTGILVVT